MSTCRRIESVSGPAAAVVGLLALAYTIFGPFYYGCETSGIGPGETPPTTTCGSANMLQMGIAPGALVFFGLLLLIWLGIASGATLHSRSQHTVWRVVLWTATGVLLNFVFLAGLSIGPFLWPSVLLALVACLSSLGVRDAAVA